MFVLSNAWRALTRSKGRTALTAFITLAVTFGTVAGLAIIQEDTNAHTTTYPGGGRVRLFCHSFGESAG